MPACTAFGRSAAGIAGAAGSFGVLPAPGRSVGASAW